jgi:phosphohistidine swiveling domain-containing protein
MALIVTNLFYSDTAQNILGILCQAPNEQYHINDIIRKTGKYPYSVQTALKKLENFNLVKTFKFSNKKFYQINKENPIFPEIRNIFSKLNTLVDTKLAPLFEEIKWVKTVNRPSPLPLQDSLANGLDEPMKYFFGSPFKYYWFNGATGGCYYSFEELEKASQRISQLVKDPRKTTKLLKTFDEWSHELIIKARELNQTYFSGGKSKGIVDKISSFNSAFAKIHPVFIAPNVIEKAILSDIKNSLELILSVKKRGRKLNDYLDLLTSADEGIEERRNALRIAAYIKNHGLNKKTVKLLTSHAQKYSFASMYQLSDSPLTINDFRQEVKSIIAKYKSPEKELFEIEKQAAKKAKETNKFLKEFNPPEMFKEKVRLFKKVNNLRSKRAYSTSMANFYFRPVFLDILKKMKIPPKYHFYLTLGEIIQYLKRGAKPNLATLQRRHQGWAILVWKGRMRLITGLKEIIETMERLKIIPEVPRGIYALPKTYEVQDYPKNLKKLSGTAVFGGTVKGRVKIIEENKDCRKVKIGDIIVSNIATPAYLYALYKAAGLITNEGGLTSHAALYAKALKIPTIIGTQVATDVFKDGDLVEINTLKGIVQKINN